VLELAAHILKRAELSSPEPQLAILTPAYRAAESCRSYFAKVGIADSKIICVRLSGDIAVVKDGQIPSDDTPDKQLYAVTYPESRAPEGKAFWQHTGAGITTRTAVYWLEHAPFLENRQVYAEMSPAKLPLEEGDEAVITIRERIADTVSSPSFLVRVDDVTLYPTGMSAISNTSLAIRSLFDRQDGIHRVAVFGCVFPPLLALFSIDNIGPDSCMWIHLKSWAKSTAWNVAYTATAQTRIWMPWKKIWTTVSLSTHCIQSSPVILSYDHQIWNAYTNYPKNTDLS
jgi:hypothetical protein